MNCNHAECNATGVESPTHIALEADSRSNPITHIEGAIAQYREGVVTEKECYAAIATIAAEAWGTIPE